MRSVVRSRTSPADLQGLLEHFVEAYWLTAHSLSKLKDGPLAEKEFITRTLQYGDRLYVKGELLWLESMSREIIKNAIKTFVEKGLLESTSLEGKRGRTIRLAERGPLQEDCEEVAKELAVYLRRD